MKKPAIANLNSQQRKDMIESIKQSTPEFEYKEIALEALDFYNTLLEELKSSKISINRLRQLLGFKNEQLKKLIQAR